MSEPITFTLSMDQDLYAKLRLAAEASGGSVDGLLLNALSEYISPVPKAEPLTREVWTADFAALEKRVLDLMARRAPVIVRFGDGDFDSEMAKHRVSLAERLSELTGLHSGGYVDGSNTSLVGEGSDILKTGLDRPVSGLNTLSTLHVINDVAQNRVEVPIEEWMTRPLHGQEWVITGSLETMTRDRAREILMALGATVSGAVTQKTFALVWGPGAGSKKTLAQKFGTQQLNETQFVKFIRRHGVDMPLPKGEHQ